MHDLVHEGLAERSLGGVRGVVEQRADPARREAAAARDVGDDLAVGVREDLAVLRAVGRARARLGEGLARALVLVDADDLDLDPELGQRLLEVELRRRDAVGVERPRGVDVDLLRSGRDVVLLQRRALEVREHVAARVADADERLAELVQRRPAGLGVGVHDEDRPIAGLARPLEPLQHRDEAALVADVRELDPLGVDPSRPVHAIVAQRADVGLEADAVGAAVGARVHAGARADHVPAQLDRHAAAHRLVGAQGLKRRPVEHRRLDLLDLTHEGQAAVAQGDAAAGEESRRAADAIELAARLGAREHGPHAAGELEGARAEGADRRLRDQRGLRLEHRITQVSRAEAYVHADGAVVADPIQRADVEIGPAKPAVVAADAVHGDAEAALVAEAARDRPRQLGRGRVAIEGEIRGALAELRLQELGAEAHCEPEAEVGGDERPEAAAARELRQRLVAEQREVQRRRGGEQRGVELHARRVALARVVVDRAIDAVGDRALLGGGRRRGGERGPAPHGGRHGPEDRCLHWISSWPMMSTIAST